MAGYKLVGRSSSSRSAPTLLDLPQSTLVHIAELLPCKDLPSLICSCRELARMADAFYSGRRVLDMRCFVEVPPLLCKQLLRRFAPSQLDKCVFRCCISDPYAPPGSPASDAAFSLDSDEDEEPYEHVKHDDQALIVERFLDNYCCDGELLSDLRTRFSSSMDWFDDATRPIDVLAHCHSLDLLLSTQPALKDLVLDTEYSIFRVPKSKGYRQHWHLMQPFLALQVIQKKCPLIEKYMAHEVRYQSSTLDLQHLQVRFLQQSKRLKFIGIRFGLDRASLENYQDIRCSLALEKAVFFISRWCLSDADRLQSYGLMRYFALRMPKCEFNPGYPNFDIDEGHENGPFFEGLWPVVSQTVESLTLLDVPEDEFDFLFGGDEERAGKLPDSVQELKVSFLWHSGKELGEEQEAMISNFINSLPTLKVCRVDAFFPNGGRVAFSKTW